MGMKSTSLYGTRARISLLLGWLVVAIALLGRTRVSSDEWNPQPPLDHGEVVEPTPNIFPTIDPTRDALELEEFRKARGEPQIARLADVTRGKEVTIAGRKVQLPEDAYVEGISWNMCIVGEPCHPVTFGIVRGTSTVGVDAQTGEILYNTLKPTEEQLIDREAFQFLEEAFTAAGQNE